MIIIGLQYLGKYVTYGFSRRVLLKGDPDGLIIKGDIPLRIKYIPWPSALEMKIEEKDNVATIFSNIYVIITRKKIEESFKRTLEELFEDEKVDAYTNRCKVLEDECIRVIPQIRDTYYPPIAICKI